MFASLKFKKKKCLYLVAVELVGVCLNSVVNLTPNSRPHKLKKHRQVDRFFRRLSYTVQTFSTETALKLFFDM